MQVDREAVKLLGQLRIKREDVLRILRWLSSHHLPSLRALILSFSRAASSFGSFPFRKKRVNEALTLRAATRCCADKAPSNVALTLRAATQCCAGKGLNSRNQDGFELKSRLRLNLFKKKLSRDASPSNVALTLRAATRCCADKAPSNVALTRRLRLSLLHGTRTDRTEFLEVERLNLIPPFAFLPRAAQTKPRATKH